MITEKQIKELIEKYTMRCSVDVAEALIKHPIHKEQIIAQGKAQVAADLAMSFFGYMSNNLHHIVSYGQGTGVAEGKILVVTTEHFNALLCEILDLAKDEALKLMEEKTP